MKCTPSIVVPFLLTLCCFQEASPAEANAGIRNFTIHDGLTHTFATTLYQDSLGFLWIGTRDGLNKYDGYGFTTYTSIPYDSSTLSDNYIRSIAEDRSGDLWIGTGNGLNHLNRKTGSMTRYYADRTDRNALQEPAIYALMADTSGMLWIKTRSYLTRLNTESGEFTHYMHETDPERGADDRAGSAIIEDEYERIWFNAPEGLYCLFPGGHLEPFNDYPVTALATTPDRDLWIGTHRGMFRFRPLENLKDPFNLRITQIRGSHIRHIAAAPQGKLLVATGQGYSLFNPSTSETSFFSYREITGFDPGSSLVQSIISDHSGIIWIASPYGLFKIDEKRYQFRLFHRESPGMELLGSNNITAIHADHAGLWLGTASGLCLYSQGRIKPFPVLEGKHIHSLHSASDSLLLIGTDDGLFSYLPGYGTATELCTLLPGMSCSLFDHNPVYSILEDRAGNTWIGTKKALYKYHREQGILYTVGTVFSGQDTFRVGNVFTLCEDAGGQIWFGTDKGLVRHDPAGDAYEVYRSADEGHTLSGGTIYQVYPDLKGRVWIGTSTGLHRYVREMNGFYLYTRKDGLPDDHVYAITEDRRGALWVSTNKGLSRISPENMEFSNYGLSDGIRNYQFNLGAAARDDNGLLYFGGISGINVFHPDSIPENMYIPNIVFTSFELDGERGKLVRPLEKALRVIVPRGNQVFTIRFSALDFSAPEKNHYQYKLVKNEHDQVWIDIGNQNDVTFYNLPPGRYTFTVRGSNSDQKWNKTGASLDVIVPTPRWQSIQAYIGYGVIALILIYFVIQMRTRTLRRANRILKEKELVAREVALQREELMIKNKNITDSINYARRIQFAMIPTREQFLKILPESFVLYKPKDIVSGDFYWITENQDKVYVAAIDCTGHGVPGAFMSIIGFELFRNITGVQQEPNPAQVLNILNENFVAIFADGEQVYLKDGMDLSLCVFDKHDQFLEFSGAYNPLYLIRDGTIIEIKADRFSVGADIVQRPTDQRQFKSHKLFLQDDDILYMFSDGYADQFGGPEGKKFKYRRFRHLLLTIHKLPMERQLSILDGSIEEWKKGTDQIDDILVMGIRPVFGHSKG